MKTHPIMDHGGELLPKSHAKKIQTIFDHRCMSIRELISAPQFATASACGEITVIEKPGRVFKRMTWITISINRHSMPISLLEHKPHPKYGLPECRPILKVLCISVAHFMGKFCQTGDVINFPRIHLYGLDTWVARTMTNITALDDGRFHKNKRNMDMLLKAKNFRLYAESRRLDAQEKDGSNGQESKAGDPWDW